MSLIGAAMLGFGLGARHAFEADHIAAVCTLVTRDGSLARAATSGALWGVGHSAVIILAGGALVATGLSVPGPIAIALDIAVAAMLIVLGASALRAARHERAHAHHPSHEHTRRSPRRPLLVGLVHGASGTAALTLLVASTFHVRAEALAFILIFGTASVLGMAAAATLLAWPLRKAARSAPALAEGLRRVAGVASILIGIVVAWTTLAGGSTN